MKVRLLKKLRKEAKKEIWLEYWPGTTKPYKARASWNSSDGFCNDFFNKKEAIEYIRRRRREKILDRLQEIGKTKLDV